MHGRPSRVLIVCTCDKRRRLPLRCWSQLGVHVPRNRFGRAVLEDQRRWQRHAQLLLELLRELAESCDEFLVHGVDVEGTRVGIDDALVTLLGDCSPVPVTYAGGAAALADLDRVKALGRGRVDLTIGSALDVFGGDIPYADVLAWQAREDAS